MSLNRRQVLAGAAATAGAAILPAIAAAEDEADIMIEGVFGAANSGPPFQYFSLADTVRENGWRHMDRALMHREAGHEDWAQGSFRKAIRNFDRADKLDGLDQPSTQWGPLCMSDLDPPGLERCYNTIAYKVA